MARTHAQIVADIHAFTEPANGNWLGLDALITELWQSGRPQDAIPDLLGVFERMPTAHSGPLWGILHGLEALPGYEPHVARSVQRVPAEFGVMMLGRLLNGGVTDIDGEPIYPMLQAVADNSDLPAEIREMATGFMERHPHLRPPVAVRHEVTGRARKK